MSLIKSISGIRGTIGGVPGEGLTPLDIIKFTAAYAKLRKEASGTGKMKIVVGRDARISGEMVESLVCSTLRGMGCDVINIGLATTPTTEMAVTGEKANGGIILTASHNPRQWNALKLLNENGEFLDSDEGKTVIRYAEDEKFIFAEVDDIGKIENKDYLQQHIKKILALPLVDKAAIEKANFSVAFDSINSVGGIAIPELLKALGVKKVLPINGEPTGEFFHIPEPLPENLVTTCEIVKNNSVDVCFVVDPDVDRLSIISEDGSMFNEEYTLVSVADYVLSHTPGNTVSNLSSSRALRVITEKHGGKYEASAVGEVNVVAKIKETKAVIGGEGNGGVIYPELHYGRDSLVGIALFLTMMAKSGKKCSEIRKTFPDYFISKNKIQLTQGINPEEILDKMKQKYKGEKITDIDGVKIDFKEEWVHLRKSNTEPIIRIYAESGSIEKADALAKRFIGEMQQMIKS